MAAAGTAYSAVAPVLAVAAVSGAFLCWRRVTVATCLFLPAAAVCGLFYYHLFFDIRAAGASLPKEPAVFQGMIASEPGRSAKTEHFDLRLAPPWKGTVHVFVPPGSGFRYGDLLELMGKVEPPELKRDLPAAVFPQAKLVDRGRGVPLRQALFGLKRHLLAVLPGYLPAEEAAFLGGITLGAKAEFPPEFLQALAASGTTHLVALSGYNIAILVFVVFGACLALLGRRPAFYVTVAAIFIFVLMVGAEPSVVRAAIMGCLVLLGREIGRPYGLPYALLWTAFFMTLADPGALFMPGFQLSFISLLGIVYLSPVISKWFGVPGSTAADAGAAPSFLGSFHESAALTVAAQLAVAPVALNSFGGVPLSAFIANALILPFMPLTMFLGFVLIACGTLFAPLGAVAGMAAHILLAYETAIIRFFARLSFPVTATLSPAAILAYYFFLATLIRRHDLHEDER